MSDSLNGETPADPRLRIHVSPETDDETIAVIVAAVRRYVQANHNADERVDWKPVNHTSRWVMAGRREAMKGRGDGVIGR